MMSSVFVWVFLGGRGVDWGGVVVIACKQNSNCSFGMALDGIYYAPKIQQSVSRLEGEVLFFLFLCASENGLFALVRDNLQFSLFS